MIKKKTVFILGAGASVPYGFPTGVQLKNSIQDINIENAMQKAYLDRKHHDHHPIWRYVFDTFGRELVREFCTDLENSGRYSVDAFLEVRRKYIRLGKALISRELIKYENDNSLYVRDGNWYQYLYNILFVDKSDLNNIVSILTFNYDRSLERYMIKCIQSDYGKSIEEAAEMLGKIPIIHLHGSLGKLPELSDSPEIREYSTTLTIESINVSSNSIKIISESDSKHDVLFKKAYELLAEARQVWFLGFGYHPTNLARLKIPEILHKGCKVFGTTFEFRRGQVISTARLFKGNFELAAADNEGNLNALDYLKEYEDYLLSD